MHGGSDESTLTNPKIKCLWLKWKYFGQESSKSHIESCNLQSELSVFLNLVFWKAVSGQSI